MSRKTVTIISAVAAALLIIGVVFSQLTGNDTDQYAPDAQTVPVVPANPAPSAPEPDAEPTTAPPAPEDATQGPTEPQEPGHNHGDHIEGIDEVVAGLREPTEQESIAMTAVSAYMRQDTSEDAFDRRDRLREWFSMDAGEPHEPIHHALTSAHEGIMDSRFGHVTTLDEDLDNGRATVEVGLTYNMVLTVHPDEPRISQGGDMVFEVDLREIDGAWKADGLRRVS